MGPARQSLGGRRLAGFILQPRDPVLLVAMQPGAHDVLTTGMDLSKLGNSEPTVRLEHQSPRARPRDRLPADSRSPTPAAGMRLPACGSSFLPPSCEGGENDAKLMTTCLGCVDVRCTVCY